jgi:hypothetical protein
MIEDMQLRGLSPNTQIAYVRSVRQLAEYWGKSPQEIKEEELRRCFLHLKNEKRVSSSTFSVMFYAIKFLYQYTLQRNQFASSCRAARFARLGSGPGCLAAATLPGQPHLSASFDGGSEMETLISCWMAHHRDGIASAPSHLLSIRCCPTDTKPQVPV